MIWMGTRAHGRVLEVDVPGYFPEELTLEQWLERLGSGNAPPNQTWKHEVGRDAQREIESQGWSVVSTKYRRSRYRGGLSRNSSKFIYRSDGHDFEIHFTVFRTHIPLMWIGCKRIK